MKFTRYPTHAFLQIFGLLILVCWWPRYANRPGFQISRHRALLLQIGFGASPTIWPLVHRWQRDRDARAMRDYSFY